MLQTLEERKRKQKAWKKANKKHLKKYQKAYRAAHRETYNTHSREWYHRNSDRIKATTRANGPKIQQRRKELRTQLRIDLAAWVQESLEKTNPKPKVKKALIKLASRLSNLERRSPIRF